MPTAVPRGTGTDGRTNRRPKWRADAGSAPATNDVSATFSVVFRSEHRCSQLPRPTRPEDLPNIRVGDIRTTHAPSRLDRNRMRRSHLDRGRPGERAPGAGASQRPTVSVPPHRPGPDPAGLRDAGTRSGSGRIRTETEVAGQFDGRRTTCPVRADRAGGRTVADQMDPRIRRDPGRGAAGHGDPAARAP